MTRSIGAGEPASPGHGLMVRSMLQPGLWPVTQIERFPRICFVSLVLLGYPASFCAQTLVVAESEVPTLLQKAFTQLCSITAAAWRKA